MSKVALVKSQELRSGVMEAIKLITPELKRKLAGIDEIVIKINFVNAHKPLATTPVEAVRGFIEAIKPFYKGRIVIAEEATFGNTTKAFERYGYTQLVKDFERVKVIDAGKEKADMTTINYQGGKIVLPMNRVYTKAKFIVSITRAKTHNAVVVTLGIKNLLVGAIKHGLLMQRFKIHLGNKLNYILAGLAEVVYPDLVIIDGTVGMEGDGPGDGTPIKSGWVVASLDALAADTLATHLMGFDVLDVGYLTFLGEKKKGAVYGRDKVEVVGEKPEKLVKKYQPSPTFAKQRLWQRG